MSGGAPLAAPEVTARDDADDPVPAGMRAGAPVRVPIGYVEAAAGDGGRWFGGDALTSNDGLDASARGEGGDVLLEGARWEDFAAALP